MRHCLAPIGRSLGLGQSLNGLEIGRGCTVAVLCLFVLSGLAVGFATGQGTESARDIVMQSLVDTVADLLLIGGYFGGFLRWRQSAVARPFLVLVVAVLALLGFVLAGFWQLGDWLHMPKDAVSGGYAAAILLLFMWNLMAVGQLTRQALNLSALVGLMVALGYFVVSGVLIAGLNLWLWPGQA